MTAPERPTFHFDRHDPQWRIDFEQVTAQIQSECPVAWTETYGGHWVAGGNAELFEIIRADVLSNDRDLHGERQGFFGVGIPSMEIPYRGGFLEMDPPEQRPFRDVLNPYLSPSAVARWKPFVHDLTRATVNEWVESGRVDFIDDLANVVPAVLTMAMLGLPLVDWDFYSEPAHAVVYTPPDSPAMPKVMDDNIAMLMRLAAAAAEIRETPRPGMIDGLVSARINGQPFPEDDLVATLGLLIGGGFDTTTALTAHTLKWLSAHPQERARLSAERETLLDSATEEFLRYFTPSQGDGRTVKEDCVVAGVRMNEGERLWVSWAMANRDPEVFPDPNVLDMERKGNRHSSFGLGHHRCIGSNMARMTFKAMLTEVLDRVPDFVVDTSGAVGYETVGVINGMVHLPATFTPGSKVGPDLAETLVHLQERCDTEQLARPYTRG